MKKEYNFLEIRLVYFSEADVVTLSTEAPATSSDKDIIGNDIF